MQPSSKRSSIPFWRDVRVLRIVGQALFLLVVGAVIGWLISNLRSNLANSGLNLGFRFLGETAGFPISEGIAYDPTQSNGFAFWVGIINTLRIAGVGIIFATVIGVIVGVSRLSANWLVRRLATFYVETLRNIPLLVQLFFWYFAVILTAFPLVSESIRLPGAIYLSRRGLVMPRLIPTGTFSLWFWFLLGGFLVGAAMTLVRRARLKKADRPGFPIIWGLGAFAAVAAIGWVIIPGVPLAFEIPTFERFNFSGGISLSSPF